MAETACPVFHLKTLFAHVLFKNSVSHPPFLLEVAINDRCNRFKAVFLYSKLALWASSNGLRKQKNKKMGNIS